MEMYGAYPHDGSFAEYVLVEEDFAYPIPPTMTDQDTTRVSLHAVAEYLLAGPQYKQHQTIRLRVTPGGFATITGPDLRVHPL